MKVEPEDWPSRTPPGQNFVMFVGCQTRNGLKVEGCVNIWINSNKLQLVGGKTPRFLVGKMIGHLGFWDPLLS